MDAASFEKRYLLPFVPVPPDGIIVELIPRSSRARRTFSIVVSGSFTFIFVCRCLAARLLGRALRRRARVEFIEVVLVQSQAAHPCGAAMQMEFLCGTTGIGR